MLFVGVLTSVDLRLSEEKMSEALDHIKVIDVTAARAGPSCVRILADLGANVIQVARPGVDGVDSGLPKADKANLHRNKRSIVIDLQKEKGHELFLRLVKGADVVVENFRPDVKHRLGIDYDSLSKLNPRLIYGSISGFGQDGPYGPRPGVDQIAQGMGGLMSVTGPPGSGPWRVGTAICDLTAGMFLAHAVMAALIEREKSGQGQWVHTSLLEACVSLLDFQAARWLIDGEVPGQAGNDHPTMAPTGVFPTKNGMVNIAATGDRAFRNFINALDLPDLATDGRFQTARARGRNREDLRTLIEAKTTQFSSDELLELLALAGVPSGPILAIDEVFANPQVQHLDMTPEVESPEDGTQRLLRLAFNLSRTPPKVKTAAPTPGKQTRAILSELGVTQEEIEKLATDRIIVG